MDSAEGVEGVDSEAGADGATGAGQSGPGPAMRRAASRTELVRRAERLAEAEGGGSGRRSRTPRSQRSARFAQRSDAELVALAAGGYGAAFGVLIDRHGAAVYDLCRQMLPTSFDANRLTTEIFLLAAEHLWQLREQDSVRPWLLAIARHEIHQELKHSKAPAPSGASRLDAPELDLSGDIAPSVLPGLLRDASVVLGERERTLFELSFAHGLSGSDLADAMGVREENALVLTGALRDHLATAVVSLVLLRQGRRNCAVLADLAGDWDGSFNRNLDKRVARHAASCPVCGEVAKAVPPLVFSGTGWAAADDVEFAALPDRLHADSLAGFDDRAGLAGDDPDRRREFRSFARSHTTAIAPILSALGAVATVVVVVAGITWISSQRGSVRVEAAVATRGADQPAPNRATTTTTIVTDPSVVSAVAAVPAAVEVAAVVPATIDSAVGSDPTAPTTRPSPTTTRPKRPGSLPLLVLPGFYLTGPAATPSFNPPPVPTPPNPVVTSPPTTERPTPPTTRPPSPTTTRPHVTTTTAPPRTTTTTTAPPPTTTTTTAPPPTTTTTTAPPPTTTTTEAPTTTVAPPVETP